MKEAIYDYDPAAALDGPETITIFMADAFETGNAEYIAKAMGVVARAKGMTEIARETGLSREQLYRSFSDKGNPMLKTMLAVMQALGIDMTARPHDSTYPRCNPLPTTPRIPLRSRDATPALRDSFIVTKNGAPCEAHPRNEPFLVSETDP